MEILLKLPANASLANHETPPATDGSQRTRPWLTRLAISEMTTIRWSLLDDVVYLRSEGVDSIGVWRRKVTEFGEERAVELLRDSGLTVASVSSAGGFTGYGGHSYRSSVADALDALRLASDLQAGCLVVVSGSRAGHTHRHFRQILRDALREVGDVAAQCGIPLALLPMHPRFAGEASFLMTLDQTLEVLHDCAHPFVGLAFDVFQLAQTRDLVARVPDALPWIKTVQLSDWRMNPRPGNDRVLPGEGILPIAEIVEQLEAGGYQGYYDFEIWSDELWKVDYVQLVQRCRQSFQDLARNHRLQPAATEA